VSDFRRVVARMLEVQIDSLERMKRLALHRDMRLQCDVLVSMLERELRRASDGRE